MTIGDKIRQMPDEELTDEVILAHCFKRDCPEELLTCRECTLRWLKQETPKREEDEC